MEGEIIVGVLVLQMMRLSADASTPASASARRAASVAMLTASCVASAIRRDSMPVRSKMPSPPGTLGAKPGRRGASSALEMLLRPRTTPSPCSITAAGPAGVGVDGLGRRGGARA